MFDTTVIIPTKDRLEMLKRAVNSISLQTLLPRKVIIVDDCSYEKVTIESFIEFPNLDISIITNNKSLGGAVCRNIGIKKSNTQFLSFLDDDDAWDKTYLAEIKNANEGYVGNKEIYFSSKRFVLSTSLDYVFKESIANQIPEQNDFLSGNPIGTTSCVTASKSSLVEVGFFDEALPALQDYELWLRLSRNMNVFIPVENAFVLYTINLGSKQISGNFNNHIYASKIIIKKYSNLMSKQDYKKLFGTLSFCVAKAIHRRSYSKSVKYTFVTIFYTKKIKSFALLIPYKVFNFFGVYTS